MLDMPSSGMHQELHAPRNELQGGCASVPVGGGFRAVRKLLAQRPCDDAGSGDDDQSTAVGSESDEESVQVASGRSAHLQSEHCLKLSSDFVQHPWVDLEVQCSENKSF